jgi:hypothetical protein
MMKRLLYIQPALILIFVIVGGCNSRSSNNPISLVASQTKAVGKVTLITPSVTLFPTLTPILSPTSRIVTSTSTVTSVPTATLIALTLPPTLPPDKAQEMVSRMVMNNGGCQLPCWWGITPGKSTWVETVNTLAPFVSNIELHQLGGGVDSNGNTQPDFIAIVSYLNNNVSKSLELSVTNGIVDSINADDDTSSYKVSALGKLLGDPPLIYVNTVDVSPSGTVPFVLVVYYPDKGIIATYIEESHAPIEGKNVVFCARDIAPMTMFWDPEQGRNDQYQKIFFDSIDYWVNDDGLHPIEEVNSASRSTINATLRETGCIYVSVDLWHKLYTH